MHHDGILPDATRQAEVQAIHLLNEKRNCVTVSRASPTSNLTVAYWHTSQEKTVSKYTIPRDHIRRIAVSPFGNNFTLLACGKSYLKFWDFEKDPSEKKETAIPIKYERENDFINCVFLGKEPKFFLTVSA